MIRIHFRYGSKPEEKSRGFKEAGGLLGGHVYIEFQDYFYGFLPENEARMHIFPRKRFNALLKKESFEQWVSSEHRKKILSIDVPLTREQEEKLDGILEKYQNKTPYDYAVLGMRCASSSYEILSQIGLFPETSLFMSMLLVPYPRLLRKRLVTIAKRNGWLTTLQQGKPGRIWEKG